VGQVRQVPADVRLQPVQFFGAFAAMDFNSRGELLKKIAGDDALLARCAEAYRAGRLREELRGLIG